MDTQLIALQGLINGSLGWLGGVNADPASNKELLAEAEAELAAAQAAHDAAQAAHDAGDDATANIKLRESANHVNRALLLIRQAMGK